MQGEIWRICGEELDHCAAETMSQAEVSWPFISMTSGAIQYGVPTTELLFSESVSLVATPKSASLTIPSLVVRILPPFMSL
jgi:hypothetical protein